MIFDHTNPRHLEILSEELTRARRVLALTEEAENQSGYDPDTLLAVKDKNLGRPLYRGLTHMMKEDPRYNYLLANFLRRVNKAALEDLSVAEINKFFTMFIRFKERLNPSSNKMGDGSSSGLDADSYKAGQGRGGWQGD
jgi:hypothetical protein